MTTPMDQQLLDYKELLKTHVTSDFAAAVPIMEFILEEGIKFFTHMHMKWEGIQGIRLFEFEWEEGTPLAMKSKHLGSRRKRI